MGICSRQTESFFRLQLTTFMEGTSSTVSRSKTNEERKSNHNERTLHPQPPPLLCTEPQGLQQLGVTSVIICLKQNAADPGTRQRTQPRLCVETHFLSLSRTQEFPRAMPVRGETSKNKTQSSWNLRTLGRLGYQCPWFRNRTSKYCFVWFTPAPAVVLYTEPGPAGLCSANGQVGGGC